MIILAMSIIGGFMNAVRGGQFKVYRNKFESLFGIKHDKNLRAIKPLTVFQTIVNQLASGDFLNAFIFGLASSMLLCENAFFASIFMWVGAASGWGAYINAMAHDRIDRDEIPFIDKLISGFTDNPRLWGLIGLTLRGCMWGISLSLLSFSLLPLVAGALMGVVYYPFMVYMENKSRAWNIAEYVFGAVLWGAVAVTAVLLGS